MSDKHTVAELSRCVRQCKDDAACQQGCEDTFVAAGGTVVVGNDGKTFTDRDGGKVFIPNPK